MVFLIKCEVVFFQLIKTQGRFGRPHKPSEIVWNVIIFDSCFFFSIILFPYFLLLFWAMPDFNFSDYLSASSAGHLLIFCFFLSPHLPGTVCVCVYTCICKAYCVPLTLFIYTHVKSWHLGSLRPLEELIPGWDCLCLSLSQQPLCSCSCAYRVQRVEFPSAGACQLVVSAGLVQATLFIVHFSWISRGHYVT